MRTLTYWIAERLDQSSAYSIRRRTRREVLAELNKYGCSLVKNPSTREHEHRDDVGRCWTRPRKVVVQYQDVFDLIYMALGEGGIE